MKNGWDKLKLVESYAALSNRDWESLYWEISLYKDILKFPTAHQEEALIVLQRINKY